MRAVGINRRRDGTKRGARGLSTSRDVARRRITRWRVTDVGHQDKRRREKDNDEGEERGNTQGNKRGGVGKKQGGGGLRAAQRNAGDPPRLRCSDPRGIPEGGGGKRTAEVGLWPKWIFGGPRRVRGGNRPSRARGRTPPTHHRQPRRQFSPATTTTAAASTCLPSRCAAASAFCCSSRRSSVTPVIL